MVSDWRACAVRADSQNRPVPTIAILGASNDRAKFGNKAVRAFAQQGWTVFPVNPKERVIESLTAFARVSEAPAKLDRVSVYLPPAVTLKLLPEVAAKGCGELWLNPGAASPEVLAEAERLGLNVIQACSILDVGVSPFKL